MLAGLGHALAVLQDRPAALRVVADLERCRADKGLFAYELAIIHDAFGDREQTIKWLQRAIDERSGWIAYLRVDPRLDALRGDERFDALLSAATPSSPVASQNA
jgi:hypothetical protein